MIRCHGFQLTEDPAKPADCQILTHVLHLDAEILREVESGSGGIVVAENTVSPGGKPAEPEL